jgi:acyl transferase domain-containing protein
MTATLQTLSNVRAEAETMLTIHVANHPGVDAETLCDLLSPDQRFLLNQAGFASPAQVAMEVGRARAVAELKARAGTSKARKQAEKEAAAAAKMLSNESAPLKSAIAEMETKLTLLEREARDTAAKRDAMQAAVAHLRSDRFLPKHISEQANYAKRRVKASGDAETLRELEGELQSLKVAIEVDNDGGDVSRLDFAKLHVPGAVDKSVDDNRISYSLNVEGWSQHIDRCKSEAAKLEPVVEPLRSKVDSELSLCEGCRDLYVAELG